MHHSNTTTALLHSFFKCINNYYTNPTLSCGNDQNDGVASQKHFADEPVLGDGLAGLAAGGFRFFRPHLLHVLQHHVGVPVKRLDSGQQLFVVSARYQHLCVVLYCPLQQRQGTM